MMQQEHIRASPDVHASFREVVLFNVQYQLRIEGPEKTKADFELLNRRFSRIDGWAEIARTADLMILKYSQKNGLAMTVSIEKGISNTIMKKNHNGHPIDFYSLRLIIEKCFVKELKHSYDWLALWRILFDLKLLEETKQEPFAKQMQAWYPDALKRCKADAIGDYSQPYLGMTPFVSWDEEAFKSHKTTKQSVTGFRRLYHLCEALKEQLSQIPVIR